MKKVFPLIVALITLSLMGIIYIQVNWIKSAALIKQEQEHNQLVAALRMVGDQLLKDPSPMTMESLQKRVQGNPALSLMLDRMGTDLMNQTIPISFRYTKDQIKAIIKNALIKKNLDPNFEFALITNISLFQNFMIKSKGFYQALADSAHHDNIVYILSNGDGINTPSETLSLIVSKSAIVNLRALEWMISGSILFTLIIIAAFSLTIFTMLRQKKLSEIKSDFINNMTHEFKTPISTISLAVDAIGNEKVKNDQEKIAYFTAIIREENKRMNKQVETILQSALLEKERVNLNLQPLDVHRVLEKIGRNIQLQLQQRGGQLKMELHAENPVIQADEVHFSNIISNLIDNAIKYSKEDLQILLKSRNTRFGLSLVIEDNGIGMTKETQSRIFEKFYRAHTGNLHNVKGFGLGLAYVKAIADAHKGKIRVESTLGKGSSFELDFPQPSSSHSPQGSA
ncbi:MAG: sensor histidine kinase [Chitinophagaceae bacterium]